MSKVTFRVTLDVPDEATGEDFEALVSTVQKLLGPVGPSVQVEIEA